MVDEVVRGQRVDLPQRAEFRELLRQWQHANAPEHADSPTVNPALAGDRFGCLVLLRVPRHRIDTDTVARLLEERLRERDKLALLGSRGLGVLLRQCTHTGAEQILGHLLRDLVRHADGSDDGTGSLMSPRQLGLRHRVIALRPGAMSLHVGRPGAGATDTPRVTRVTRGDSASAMVSRVNRSTELSRLHDAERLARFRGEPGVRLNQLETLSCLRLRSLQLISESSDQDGVMVAMAALTHRSPKADSALRSTSQVASASATKPTEQRPASLPMLIVSLSGPPVTQPLHAWLLERAADIRLSRGELCLAFTLGTSATPDLPVVRQLAALRRAGYRLMLQQGGDVLPSQQYRRLPMDLLCLSSRALQSADVDPLQRARLNRVIVEAHAAGWLVSINGVDSEALHRLAAGMGVDLGFGRLCGRSQPLQSFLNAHRALR